MPASRCDRTPRFLLGSQSNRTRHAGSIGQHTDRIGTRDDDEPTYARLRVRASSSGSVLRSLLRDVEIKQASNHLLVLRVVLLRFLLEEVHAPAT